MTQETYERISAPFRNRYGIFILKSLNKGITLAIMLSYFALIVWQGILESEGLIKILSVPFVGLVILWGVRRILNTPRPYEELDIVPLIVRHKKGQSFPSRHAFSAFVIGMAWGYVVRWTMIPFFVAGAVLATVRVIGGIHYPKDVVAGILFGLLAGVIGFYIL